jgi:DNA-binding transcriptional LysR family regulator
VIRRAFPCSAGKLDFGLGIYKRMPGLRRVPFFRFSLMVIRADRDGTPDRVSTRWSALNGETLISVTAKDHHQQLIDAQLAKAGIVCRRGQTVNLLDTQIGLVEAEQGIAVIPSFGLPAYRNRKVTMSELVEPLVALEFYEISSRARKLPAEASEFSAFLKKYIARWAGASARCGKSALLPRFSRSPQHTTRHWRANSGIRSCRSLSH